MPRKVAYILERYGHPSVRSAWTIPSRHLMSDIQTMKTRIILVIIGLLALGDCLLRGADKGTKVPAAEAVSLQPEEIRATLQKRLSAALLKNDAAAAAQWAQAAASVEAAGLLAQQARIQKPIVGLLESFEPQLEALPAVIRRLAVQGALDSMASPKLREATRAFFDARKTEEAIASVHGMVAAIPLEQATSTLWWRLRTDEKAREAWVKAQPALAADKAEEAWRKDCLRRAITTTEAEFRDKGEEAKMADRSAAAERQLEVTMPPVRK